jgi:hypothetical protein
MLCILSVVRAKDSLSASTTEAIASVEVVGHHVMQVSGFVNGDYISTFNILTEYYSKWKNCYL